MRTATTLVLSLLMLGAASWAQAPTPVGDQFQINTYTTGNQDRPDVAVDDAGNFVVVWSSNGSSGTDTSGRSIQLQRYDSNGNPVGGEFQVNTYTTYSQEQPSISMDSSGNFVVVWTGNGSSGTDTSDDSVHGQLFDSAANMVGNEFQVNTYTANDQTEAVVAMDQLGNFVVVWESYGSYGTDSDSNSIQGQLYDADGDPVGGEFQVNTYTTNYQDQAEVGTDGQGNFIVVWKSNSSIQGQLYDDSGAAVGDQFQASDASSDQAWPGVAADSLGNFVISWSGLYSPGTDNSEEAIQAQRFDSGGNPVGGNFQVNTDTTDRQIDPDISMGPQGNFVVTWETWGSSGASPYSIQAQYFDSTGAPAGGEFQVDSYADSYFQDNPSVATDSQGGFVVVWDATASPGNDSRNRSSQGQRYSTGAIFADGFESGDTSSWSSTVP